MYLFRPLFFALAALFLSGCKLEVLVPEGGSVVSISGKYRCLAGELCSIDVSNAEFDESFRAIADDKHVFVGWKRAPRHLCHWAGQVCRLRTTGFTDKPRAMALLASDDVFYLEPVFRLAERYSISGRLPIQQGSAVDGDVNDEEAPFIYNDSLFNAQPLSNPVAVGGYANEVGAGAPGWLTDVGDRDDFFTLSLVRGQVVSLVVAEPEAGDLDLYLYNENGFIVDASLETGAYEQVRIARSGRYFVNVYAYSGASNYTLAAGQDLIPFKSTLALRNNFRIGEAIIDHDAEQPGVLEVQAQVAGPQLVSLQSILSTMPDRSVKSAPRPPRDWQFANQRLEDRWLTLMQIKSIRRKAGMRYVEPNFVHQPSTVIPNDEFFGLQAHFLQINLPDAWDITRGSSDVVVAVLDTGLLTRHPDLQGRILPGYDFVRNPNTSMDGDGIDPDAEDPGNDGGNGPSRFHGSHVAGTIAARTDNGIGVAGVDWRAKILPVRVLTGQGGTTYDIVQGIRYAAGLPNDSGTVPVKAADIINISLGCAACYSQSEQDAIRAARARGAVVVAAAGNDGNNVPHYPASYDGVISVGAVGPDNTVTDYSSYGPRLDLVAPGGNLNVDADGNGFGDGVLSSVADDSGQFKQYNYVFYQGTSMASPHVAGVFALMKAVNPGLGPGDIDRMLARGDLTIDLLRPGRDNLSGFGLVNARKAVLAARDYGGAADPDSPSLHINPTQLSLSFGARRLSLSNSGSGDLRVTEIRASAPWLKVVPVATDSAGLGSYQVRADLDQRPPGVYQGQITLRSTAGNLQVPVIAEKQSDVNAATTGRVYALLIDEFAAVVAEQALIADGGEYRFAFESVKEGSYYIAVGSDMDRDFFICDGGEACSKYPTRSAPELVVLDRDLDELVLPIAFDASFNSSVQASGEKRGDSSKGYRRSLPRATVASDGVSRR